MDIRVGAIAPVGSPAKAIVIPAGFIEVKVLAVRPARRTNQSSGSDRQIERRRNGSAAPDPPGARVLVVMVLDGTLVPADLESGRYRTFIRFARR
jgi:hypothetical protein